MAALRNMLSREGSVSSRLDRAGDEEVIGQASQLLAAGVWHVHEPGKAHPEHTQTLGGQSEEAQARSRQAAEDAKRKQAEARQSAVSND